jgi:hypothetical protein
MIETGKAIKTRSTKVSFGSKRRSLSRIASHRPIRAPEIIITPYQYIWNGPRVIATLLNDSIVVSIFSLLVILVAICRMMNSKYIFFHRVFDSTFTNFRTKRIKTFLKNLVDTIVTHNKVILNESGPFLLSHYRKRSQIIF